MFYSLMFDHICTFPNLLLAAYKAAKNKRSKASTAEFLFRQETELLALQHALIAKTWKSGGYRTFRIHDPKERIISAAPFRDRVVHHALCNIIEPIFECGFIFDTYANRTGKGTHRAIERFQQYARKYPFVLKCDIRKFFPSLDHQVLKQEIRRRIWCPGTLWLIDAIIDSSNPQEPVPPHFFPSDDIAPLPFGGGAGGGAERRRGLPIGNLTSQFWANVYLDRFDHFVKETLRVPGYIRYVDDFVLFARRVLTTFDATLYHDLFTIMQTKSEPIVLKSYELLKHAVPVLNRLPKNQKFVFGDRLQNHLSDLLESLIEAVYLPADAKKPLLAAVNLRLEKLRFLFRLGHELGYFSTKQYEEFVRRTDEIGRMTGGWLRSLK